MNHSEKKQFVIEFLEWMNKTAQENPMQLETDHDDIAEMFLSNYEEFSKQIIKFDDNNKWKHEITFKTFDEQSVFGHEVRLATEKEIEQSKYYPDGTPCLVRGDTTEAWKLYYADGKGRFYSITPGLKTTTWGIHQKLDINNLPK